jgi:hypothetical protein
MFLRSIHRKKDGKEGAGINRSEVGDEPRQPQRVPRTGESILALDVTPSHPETPTQLGEDAQAD